MLFVLITLAIFVMATLLIINQASFAVWAIFLGTLFFLDITYNNPGILHIIFLSSIVLFFVIAGIYPLRLNLFSRPLMPIIRKFTPVMSKTEREALEAGTIGWEGDLFSGEPNFEKLRQSKKTILSKEEQEFIDVTVHKACSMISDWDITQNLFDIPEKLWQFLKDEGFFGLIIPKHYGGHGFCATAQMLILTKLYACSSSVASTVAVPNSLGPAELLLKYGTQEQKNYYLPRLARGEELPCFALTGPNAGSDAASIPDTGVVCYGEYNGKKVLGVKLNWNKRYITLAPIATIIGLAFRLFDPENHLGKGNDIGITCALIPANTKGVTTGRRHFPLNIAFQNGPTTGKDVFLPLDCIIGGEKMAGHGWGMLMECLSAGRAISLPSSACGGLKAATFATGAYARIRKQFSQPISKFEGITEPLARILGYTYIIDSALSMTMSAVDGGTKSGVAGAILKYHATEIARIVSNDAMDIHGGKGIMLGPKNYLGRNYQAIPIGVTVEGANILTRSLIIFGQGVIRCHPYVLNELESIRNNDLKGFDRALCAHLGFAFSNFAKSIIYSATDGVFIHAPKSIYKRHYQLLKRYSSQLAFLSDFCMLVMGSKLKRKESISGRLGDILSALYLVSGVLQRAYKDGEVEEDIPLVNWCCQQLFFECEIALKGVINNFPQRWGRIFLKMVMFNHNRVKPNDRLSRKLAQLMTTSSDIRARLTDLVYTESKNDCAMGAVNDAFEKISAAEEIEKKILRAIKNKEISALSPLEQIEQALEKGVLNKEEALQMKDAEIARQKAIAVDDFDPEDLIKFKKPVSDKGDEELQEVNSEKKFELEEKDLSVVNG